jgi:hypothetical protein
MKDSNKSICDRLEAECTEFKPRPSLLDDLFSKSWISTTPYKGLYNLLIFLATITIFVDLGVRINAILKFKGKLPSKTNHCRVMVYY